MTIVVIVPVLLLAIGTTVAVRMASLAELPRGTIERLVTSGAIASELKKFTANSNQGNYSLSAQVILLTRSKLKKSCPFHDIRQNLRMWDIGQFLIHFQGTQSSNTLLVW